MSDAFHQDYLEGHLPLLLLEALPLSVVTVHILFLGATFLPLPSHQLGPVQPFPCCICFNVPALQTEQKSFVSCVFTAQAVNPSRVLSQGRLQEHLESNAQKRYPCGRSGSREPWLHMKGMPREGRLWHRPGGSQYAPFPELWQLLSLESFLYTSGGRSKVHENN